MVFFHHRVRAAQAVQAMLQHLGAVGVTAQLQFGGRTRQHLRQVIA
jgi:hypothetical protein